ncbi:succinylglutamate desuccinylase/aspartoacylase family protein [Thalassobaculum sp. OXR-137]|uniref:succinylglutamate desuccinylase/aspartoacylase domain-containing protein n=1 Tax=Thalassobaculum sp. OXR-137 TaxID=3100173 RepID=UPI002AC98986|nr:succinylglutamate desuccinylase/aspartoacylase family protein [Thalassobaculum sp. OXR-137]WPZ32544.1 succinylglutamate desuccinylase/aspartoacylase family protein [Thalassobaculum sp. OXR-137]
MTASGPSGSWPVELQAPDIERWRAGNTRIPFFTTLDSGTDGPHVMVTAITHGNELCGAIVLDAFLASGKRPRAGRLTLGFCNVAAYRSFDPAYPTLSRFVDEDMNRVWDRSTLDGRRSSVELARARAIRPLLDTVDMLLDIHSMANPVPPLMLAGSCDKGVALARKVGTPASIVTDAGHAAGARMRDYGVFNDPSDPRAALLLEAGQHWAAGTLPVAREAFDRFLVATGMLDPQDVPAAHRAAPPPQEVIQVTEAITARGRNFAFVADYLGAEKIERAGTVIAHDDGEPVVTPYDNCILIMPSRAPAPGQTAVRLGRIVDG